MSTRDGIDYGAAYFYGADAYQGPGEPMTKVREIYEEGYAITAARLIGILALPRPLAIEGEKVPYLKGVVAALRKTMEAAEQDLAAAEAAVEYAVSVREEYRG